MCCPSYTELVPVMIRSTYPSESIALSIRVWLIKAVIGSVLFPGAMVMSKMVEFPTMPCLAVARERVTLPYPTVSVLQSGEDTHHSHTMATVMTDGLGMNAKPLKFGCPAAAVALTFAPVTLKPARPLSPETISK